MQPSPDLFCYALLTDFRGYKPGYSKVVREHTNYLTWVVLKGHTNNTGGEVTPDVEGSTSGRRSTSVTSRKGPIRQARI